MISRPQPHPSRRLGVIACAAATAVATFATVVATPARAADSVTVSLAGVGPKMVEVNSNGVSYTQLANPATLLGANLNLNIDAGVAGGIKSWSAWIGVKTEYMAHSGSWSQHKDSRTFPFGARPNEWSGLARVTIPHATLEAFAVATCNDMANHLKSLGVSQQRIFSQNREVRVAVIPGASAEFSGPSGNPAPQEVTDWVDYDSGFKVRCKAAGGVAPGLDPLGGLGALTEARLTSVTLDVLHNPTPASCPTQVNVRTTYVSDRAGPFTTRVQSASGKVSQPMKFTMGEADRQGSQFVKVHQHPMLVGVSPGPTRTPTGGSGGGGAVGGGYVPTPGSGNGGFPPAGPALPGTGAPGGVVSPTTPGLFSDSLRVDVINAAPGSVSKSAYAGYQVQCPTVLNPGLPPGPGQVGFAKPVRP